MNVLQNQGWGGSWFQEAIRPVALQKQSSRVQVELGLLGQASFWGSSGPHLFTSNTGVIIAFIQP